jgi:hypothetical protein
MRYRSTLWRTRFTLAAAALAAGCAVPAGAGPGAPSPVRGSASTAAASAAAIRGAERPAPLLAPPTVPSTAAADCAPAAGVDPAAALRRAAEVTGLARRDGKILHIRHVDVRQELHQSDRSYAPFFTTTYRRESWVEPATGVQRWTDETSYILSGAIPRREWLADARGVYALRDTAVLPVPAMYPLAAEDRPLEVATVIGEWLAAGDARVLGRCA